MIECWSFFSLLIFFVCVVLYTINLLNESDGYSKWEWDSDFQDTESHTPVLYVFYCKLSMLPETVLVGNFRYLWYL